MKKKGGGLQNNHSTVLDMYNFENHQNKKETNKCKLVKRRAPA
jgi:hypothetical protein